MYQCIAFLLPGWFNEVFFSSLKTQKKKKKVLDPDVLFAFWDCTQVRCVVIVDIFKELHSIKHRETPQNNINCVQFW